MEKIGAFGRTFCGDLKIVERSWITLLTRVRHGGMPNAGPCGLPLVASVGTDCRILNGYGCIQQPRRKAFAVRPQFKRFPEP